MGRVTVMGTQIINITMAIFIDGHITNTITVTNMPASTIPINGIITTVRQGVFTNVNTAIPAIFLDTIHSQDILAGPLLTFTQPRLILTLRVFPLATAQEMVILCYATNNQWGNAP